MAETTGGDDQAAARQSVRAAISRHFKTSTLTEPGTPATEPVPTPQPGLRGLSTPEEEAYYGDPASGGAVAVEPPAGTPEPQSTAPEVQRGNPFRGVFQGAIAMLRERIPGLPSGETVPGYLAEQFRQKTSQTRTFGHSLWEIIRNPGGLVKAAWESKTEIVTGAAVGAITKEAAKFALHSFLAAEPTNLLVRAGVGALGGAAVATVKEARRQYKESYQYERKLFRDLGRNFEMKDLAQRYNELRKQWEAESDGKKRELLSDQLRYTAVFLKKVGHLSISRKDMLNTFLKSLEEVGGLEPSNDSAKEAIRRKIEQADSLRWSRIGKRALRGAAFGAAGAIAGGLLVDGFHELFKGAGSAVPGASATEPTSTPRPTLAQTQPFETATPEPSATPRPFATATPEPTATPPRPTATAVPAEPTPAAPRPPAIAPDTQAAAPPAAPEATPAAPAPTAAAPTAESLPPTTAPTGAEVSGSVADNSLTYDGKPWVLMDNGVKNIGNLFKTVGETGDIDQRALASSLQNATKLWADGQLNYTDHPDLYRIFHLSNGTGSVYNNLLDDNTLESLKKLGIVRK